MSNDKREYKSPFEDKRIILIYIIVIIAILAGVTYALQSTSIAFNIGTAIVKIDEDAYGSNVFDSSNLDMVPILDSEVETRTNNVIKIDFTVGGAQANNASKPIIYDIALVDLMLDCELVSTPYLKWKLVKNGTELSSGSFHYEFDTINNGRLVLTNIQEDLPSYSSTGNGYHNYSFYIWLSDSCQSEDLTTCVNDTTAMNGVNGLLNRPFSGKIEVELYTGSKKELVRNPSEMLDSTTCMAKYNEPNLDNGNLIPVYYDEYKEVWKKADSNNYQNSWYDYDNKKWANAVLREPNNVIDLSNNANDASIVGATWDKEEKTVTTDGVDDYINMGFANYDFGSDISLVIRVKFHSLNSYSNAFFGNWSTVGMGIEVNASGYLRGNFKTESEQYEVFSLETVTTDVWYTVVLTYNASNLVLYQDGTMLSSTVVGGDDVIDDLYFILGGDPNSTTGGVDNATAITVSDALIFDRALTASEVSSDYSGIPNPTNKNQLLAHYDFRDNSEIPVDTVIGDTEKSGTAAFYTWIPRFKYRVWNITRQAGIETTYAYPAYTNGIDIEWESGTATTGNVSCSYNVDNSSPATTLSDQCTVDGTAITPSSGNTNFTDAWYTHPAFTFGGTEKTGFWIGKFETTGTSSAPTVLPDTVSLKEQLVSSQFTSSKVFQSYGLSSSVDAHMITNLEWGAVAYLTHSIFGLCDGTTCRDVYLNNSSEYYTGRSSGMLSKDDVIYSYGIYNYKGYSLNSSTGEPTTTKDTTKIASTTGNITGVYDMSGGAREYVMANMVDSNNAFYPSASGTNWNGSTTLEAKYYNAYSYGDSASDQTAFNRARLGDATAEVTSGVSNNFNAWKPGVGIGAAYSNFVTEYTTSPWLNRSGAYNSTYPGIFNFSRENGDGVTDADSTFRVSIS